MKQWIKRILPRKCPDAPDARPANTLTDVVVPFTSVSRPVPISLAQGTSSVDLVQSNAIVSQPSTVPGHTATDVPSTNVSRPLPVSPAPGITFVDLVQSNLVVNQPSTVPGPTGIGEYIGHASCIDQHHPGSQIITLRFSTGNQAILHCEQVCTGSMTKSAPKFLPPRALHLKVEKASGFRSMVFQL